MRGRSLGAAALAAAAVLAAGCPNPPAPRAPGDDKPPPEVVLPVRDLMFDHLEVIDVAAPAAAPQPLGAAPFVTLVPRRADVASGFAYLYLRAGDPDAAARALDGVTPVSAVHHYVAAHVAFAAGDAAALDHIAAAARGWRDASTAPFVVADIHAMLGALGSVADARALVDTVAPEYDAFAVETLFAMADAAARAGRFQVAIDVLDRAVDALGGGADNPALLLRARFNQGNAALGIGDPVLAADRFVDTVAAVEACRDHAPTPTAPACTQANLDAVPANLSSVAQMFHTVYGTTLDSRYFEPAKRLYGAYLAYTPAPADVAEVRGYLDRLEQTRRTTNPAAGTHDAGRMREVLVLGKGAFTGCYAAAVRREPGVMGRVVAAVEVDDDGSVSGVTTEPRGGKQGVAAIARCVEAALRNFRFPARTVRGKTVVVVPIDFVPGPARRPDL